MDTSWVRRALSALALAGLLALGATPAIAQVPDPVDEAEEARDEAQDVLDEAAARRRAAEDGRRRADSRLNLVGSDLGAAVRTYQQLNADLEEVTFRLVDLRDQIIDQEAEVRALRAAARDYVAAAYMAGGTDEFSGILTADTYTQLLTTRTVLNRATEVSVGAVADLAAGQRELSGLHSGHDLEEAALQALREDAARLVQALDELFAEAADDATTKADQLDAARLAVAEAEAGYQQAVRRLDEEIEKRRLRTAGVEKWRPLVEKYFPPDQVWQAMAIMSCESSGIATATHSSSGAAGLFQFMAGTWGFASAGAGFAGSSPYEPEANVASAAWLVDLSIRTQHPWGPWGRWSCRTVLY